MAQRWPKAVEADMRGHLGRYEIQGNDALKPMKFTSGCVHSFNLYCLIMSRWLILPHTFFTFTGSNYLIKIATYVPNITTCGFPYVKHAKATLDF